MAYTNTDGSVLGIQDSYGGRDYSMQQFMPIQQQSVVPVQQQAQQPAIQSKQIDMKDQLANIQAIKAGQAPQGSSLGQTIGTAGGMAIGTAFGSPQAGAVVGGAVGSVVDYMINEKARKKAEEERINALMKEKYRQTKKENTANYLASLANRRGIALSREEMAMNEDQVLKNIRKNAIQNILTEVARKAEGNEMLRKKFVESRRYV